MLPLIVIIGTTASGKSSCALDIAKKINGVIVNADSRQMYRTLQIGTAKPVFDRVEDGVGYVDDVAHYLYEELDPNERGSVAVYKDRACDVIDQIHALGKIPILVGGTGFYVQAVVDNMQYGHVEIDETLRSDLNALSLNDLQHRLCEMNKDVYENTQIKNKRKLIRAIERLSSGQVDVVAGPVVYDVLQIGMRVDRDVLFERIEQRARQMVADGLVGEVRQLVERCGENIPALESIGYQEGLAFLRGEIDEQEMIEQIAIHTRQYAKRQKTWFSRDDRIVWVDGCSEALQNVNIFFPKLPK